MDAESITMMLNAWILAFRKLIRGYWSRQSDSQALAKSPGIQI